VAALWTLAFFALGLALMLRHEMWQDEWQAWLIVRESASLTDLFRHRKYEGHPAFWYLTLFLLSRVTADPLGMQLFHLLLATGTAFLFLRFSPFTRWQQILFIFGYFPLFEYGVISRNYAAGVLLIFSFCALFPAAVRGKFLVLTGLLFLLAQTSVYGLFMAAALGLMLALAVIARQGPELVVNKNQFLGGLALMGLGFIISVAQLVPPPDSGYAVGWRWHMELPFLARALAAIWNSYVPLPALEYHFWNTGIISSLYVRAGLSLILLVFPVLWLWRQPLALCLFGVGTLEILTFCYVKYPGSLRHHGHLFILLLASLWLAAYFPDKEIRNPRMNALAAWARRNKDRLLYVLLGANLLAGVWAGSMDWRYPFSAGPQVAAYLRNHGLDRMILWGDEDDAASVVAGHLRRPIFYPGSDRWGTFVIWDQQRKCLPDWELLAKAQEFADSNQCEVLLIMNREIPGPHLQVVQLQQFPDSIVPEEEFYLYLVKPGKAD
jgi:hypothetical protein